jgi:hypothetical protein
MKNKIKNPVMTLGCVIVCVVHGTWLPLAAGIYQYGNGGANGAIFMGENFSVSSMYSPSVPIASAQKDKNPLSCGFCGVRNLAPAT